MANFIFNHIPCSNFPSELHVYERWCQERTAPAWQEQMHVESAAQVSDRTSLFIMIWSWINTYYGIPEHQGLPLLLEEKYSNEQGLNATVCKQIVFLKGKRGVRVEVRTTFLCNTDQLILQNFTGTVMSVARTKKPKYAHKWHHNTNKAS